MNSELVGMMAIPGLISGITGGSYADIARQCRNEPGMSQKQYGMMLARRKRGRGQRAKRKARRRK